MAFRATPIQRPIPAAIVETPARIDAIESQLYTPPFVDLRKGIYELVANDNNAAIAAQNTARFNSALAAYSGTGATLVLPSGTIHLEQANPGQSATQRAWSIRFGPGVSKLAVVGQGSQATKLVQGGVGNSGQWDAIVVDGASEITLAGFSIEQGIITNPKVGDQMALIGVYTTQGVGTRDVTIHDVFFGPCIGDALRVLGAGESLNDPVIERLRVVNFTMRTGGHPQGAGGLAQGSRSGVSFQRGWRDVEIGNGFIHGAKNSPFEMEPTGTGVCRNALIHDLVIDNEGGQTYLALTIAGSSTAKLERAQFENITVLQGGMAVAWAFDTRLDGITIYSSGLGPMAGNAQALVQMINTNEDVTFRGKVIRDTGSTAGPLFTCTHGSGAGNTTKRVVIGGEWRSEVGPGTGAAYVDFFGPSQPVVRDLGLRLNGVSAGQYGIKFRPNTDTLDGPQVDGLRLISGNGTKLANGIWVVATNGLAITDPSITNVRAKDACTNGVTFEVAGSGTMDGAPIVQNCDFSGATNEWLATGTGASGVVFPIIAGNRGATARRWHVGTVDPEGVVTAPQGSRYTRQNGDSTTEWFKSTGTGNTGWSQVTIP